MEPLITFMETPIGILELKADSQHLLGIRLRGDPQNGKGSKNQGINKVLSLAREELERYFSQNLTRFTVPVKPVGTPFQEQAWKALLQIPYGETRSYAEQACMAGAGLATRAIGSANGANPIPIIIPCHRVIRSDGSIGGYAFGTDLKSRLLEREQFRVHPASSR